MPTPDKQRLHHKGEAALAFMRKNILRIIISMAFFQGTALCWFSPAWAPVREPERQYQQLLLGLLGQLMELSAERKLV